MSSKLKILIVDDEPDALELASFNLKAAGYEVITAADGEEALKRAREHQPALVILDLMLPEVDGLEVCKRLRARWDLPVLMLTARGDATDRIVGLELGADDYLAKPFNPVVLGARVRACLARKRARDFDLEYLRSVARVTAAALAVESGQFTVEG